MESVDIVDDDPDFCDFLNEFLGGKGYKTAVFHTVGRLLDGLVKRRPNLLILDVRLPGMDGRELVRLLRRNSETERLPIIMMSGEFHRPVDMVEGLNNGADEYLPKPVESSLLLLRVECLLRRAREANGSDAAAPLTVGPLKVDPALRVAVLSGKTLELNHMEFNVLEYLMRHPDRVLTRGSLLQTVWKRPPGIATRTVDKHMENLRKKLGEFGGWIQAVRKLGYTFVPKR